MKKLIVILIAAFVLLTPVQPAHAIPYWPASAVVMGVGFSPFFFGDDSEVNNSFGSVLLSRAGLNNPADHNGNDDQNVVPEPATLALMGFGLSLALFKRKSL